MGKIQLNEVREILYFDRSKAWSLLSQFKQGFVEKKEQMRVSEKHFSGNATAGGSLPYIASLEGTLEGGVKGVNETHVTLIPHDDVLHDLETHLEEGKMITPFNRDNCDLADLNTRERMIREPYVKITGKCVFQDSNRLIELAEGVNRVSLSQKTLSAGSNSAIAENYQKLRKFGADIAAISDHKRKKAAQVNYDNAQAELLLLMSEEAIPSENINAMKEIFDTLLGGKIVIRVFPTSLISSDSHFVCILKPESFINDSFDQVIANYGINPVVEFTVLGLVTSVPSDGSSNEKKLAFEQPEESVVKSTKSFSNLIGLYYPQFQEWETIISVCAYPSMQISPIAIYRSITCK